MSKEEGEKWVVNLIRDTKTDAKIDFKEVSLVTFGARRRRLTMFFLQNMVYMNQVPQPMYQNIIEKTRGFVFRTSAMGQAVDRKANPQGAAVFDSSGAGSRGARGGRGGAGGRGGRGGGRGGGSAQSGGRQQHANDGDASVPAPAAAEQVSAEA